MKYWILLRMFLLKFGLTGNLRLQPNHSKHICIEWLVMKFIIIISYMQSMKIIWKNIEINLFGWMICLKNVF